MSCTNSALYIAVHIFARMETIFDYRRAQGFSGDKNRLKRNVRHLVMAIVDLVVIANFLAARHHDGKTSCFERERIDRFVDGRELTAFCNALARSKLRILPGDYGLAYHTVF